MCALRPCDGMNLAGSLLDLAWPRTCAACGAGVGHEAQHVCWDCLASFSLIQAPFCSSCGDPVDGAITRDYVCSVCVDRPPQFDHARSAARYRDGLKAILQQFKYSAATHLSRDLAMLLHACVHACYSGEVFDAVAFVPLHAGKERARTYNQSALLAGELARLVDKPLARRCAVRVRSTATQTHLTARERLENVRGAFQAVNEQWIEGRRLLLVDDVMTTGATVNECARVLKAAGAARVCVVTVARG
jgi:ComF family protein